MTADFQFGYMDAAGSALDVRREKRSGCFSFLVREAVRLPGSIVQPGPMAQVRLTPSALRSLCARAGEHMGWIGPFADELDVDANTDRLPPAVAWRAAHVRAAYRLLPADALIGDVIALAQYIGEGKR